MSIIKTAREYIDTPFHWHGRVKGVGVDCAGLPICVGREIGLFPPLFDLRDYGNLPVNMIETLGAYLEEIPKDHAQTGDLLIFRIKRSPTHCGILSEWDGGKTVIHCDMRWDVQEHSLDQKWADRIVAAFDMKTFKEIHE
jgi:cell wall-associated NlpC family hydrolase